MPRCQFYCKKYSYVEPRNGHPSKLLKNCLTSASPRSLSPTEPTETRSNREIIGLQAKKRPVAAFFFTAHLKMPRKMVRKPVRIQLFFGVRRVGLRPYPPHGHILPLYYTPIKNRFETAPPASGIGCYVTTKKRGESAPVFSR